MVKAIRALLEAGFTPEEIGEMVAAVAARRAEREGLRDASGRIVAHVRDERGPATRCTCEHEGKRCVLEIEHEGDHDNAHQSWPRPARKLPGQRL